MKARYTIHAQEKLDDQITHLLSKGAVRPAANLLERVAKFVGTILTMFPRSGRYYPKRNIWEAWVPRTRVVVWYQISGDEIVVVDIWHTSQDRITVRDQGAD